MNEKIDDITEKISTLNIFEGDNETRDETRDETRNKKRSQAIIKIQKNVRGYLTRIKRLPMILYKMQFYLKVENIKFSTQTSDGRINSYLDENKVIDSLINKFGNDKIKRSKDRMWYDILIHDKHHGWLPVNIKSTTTKTSDNSCNFSMCVYAYTDEKLDFNQNYQNGKMSELFIKKVIDKKFNTNYKKDYYFLVLNKNDPTDIIINSVKGLKKITLNVNNLPFQIKWADNREFTYEKANLKLKKLITQMKKMKLSWKEIFLRDLKLLKI